jgi:hypothetical protein
MQNIPKIVRERLKTATPAGPHPDAEVLTAFAERSLAELERAVVLEHLARCGQCRDVLALALPAPEALQTVIVPARSRWLTWPALRWGAVAAGVVVVASFGILQYQRHRQPVTMVARQITRPEAVATQVQPEAAAPSPSPAQAEKQDKRLAAAPASPEAASAGKAAAALPNQQEMLAHAGAPQAAARVGAGGGMGAGVGARALAHGPKMPAQWQQQQNLPRIPTPGAAVPLPNEKQQAAGASVGAPIPPASQMVEVEASSQAAPVAVQARNEQVEVQAGVAQQQFDYAVGKAKAPVQAEAKAGAVGGVILQKETTAPALKGDNFTELAAVAPLPRWTIDSSGGLQRSFDQGKTWQDVNVNANPAPAASATTLQVVAKAARAKENPTEKKSLKAAFAVPVLRAVTAIGAEVWAGGSGGALYHSLDAGNHWARVIPSSADTTLTDDIVSLEFPDAQHGKITTSTAESWTTSDGGKTWQKQ